MYVLAQGLELRCNFSKAGRFVLPIMVSSWALADLIGLVLAIATLAWLRCQLQKTGSCRTRARWPFTREFDEERNPIWKGKRVVVLVLVLRD